MKKWLEDRGCLILILGILFVSTAIGWGINQVFTKIRMIDWINVLLSVVIGVTFLVILGVILTSYTTNAIMNAQCYEE